MYFLIIIVTILTFISSFARAQIISGNTFVVEQSTLNSFGGASSSTNFRQLNSGSETVIGESTSTNFIMRSGFLYFDTFSPRSKSWQWFDDEDNETPLNPLAEVNTAPVDIDDLNPLVLRLVIKEVGNAGSNNIKYKLQFSENSNFTTAVDVSEINNCQPTSSWCYADGTSADNALITTKLLNDTEACASGSGPGCGTHNESGVSTSSFAHVKKRAIEFSFTLKSAGASQNTTYFFRVFDVTHQQPVRRDTLATYPSLTTAGAKLTFSITGLPAATSTAGVITTVAATPLAIPFLSLNPGESAVSGHRLSVSSNALFGYRVFIFEPQNLSHDEMIIEPVTGTNETPLPFTIPAEETSAYGYHSSDDTLSGDASRFALDDTYARLENMPKEIAYHPTPISNQITDIIFKIEINEAQPPGQYTGSLKYIVVPAF